MTVTVARKTEEVFRELYYCIYSYSKSKAFVSKSQARSCIFNKHFLRTCYARPCAKDWEDDSENTDNAGAQGAVV